MQMFDNYVFQESFEIYLQNDLNKQIKPYSRNTIGKNRLNNVSLITIEKELIKLMAQNEIL